MINNITNIPDTNTFNNIMGNKQDQESQNNSNFDIDSSIRLPKISS